jgi:hypothetical protein
LLNKDQKKDRLGKDNGLLKLILSLGLGVQDRIDTMDTLVVSLHMSEIKQQSKKKAKKGQKGPVPEKVHVSRTKKGLAFF